MLVVACNTFYGYGFTGKYYQPANIKNRGAHQFGYDGATGKFYHQ